MLTPEGGGRNGDEALKKEKKRKPSVFLLFCVSVGSFRDELTMVFVHLFVRFLLIHMLLRGEGRGEGSGFCFLFLIYLGWTWVLVEKAPLPL